MTRVSRHAPTDRAALAAAVDALATVGIEAHRRVRFRPVGGGRWIQGNAVALDADGSLGLIDVRGRRRSIPVDEVEVAARGPRGGRIWVPLSELAATEEQLGLF